MLLTKQQITLLELLETYGCLKAKQVQMLLECIYGEIRFEPIVNQLIYGKKIRKQDDYLYIHSAATDNLLLDAIDVMLSFPASEIEMHKPSTAPFTLTFYKNNKNGKLNRYDVCHLPKGQEEIVSAFLENIETDRRVILFIAEDISQKKLIYTTCEHCFAIRENGVYKFYK